LPRARGIEAFRRAACQPADLLVAFAARLGAQHIPEREHGHGHKFHVSSCWRTEETAALAAVAATAPPTTPKATLVSRRVSAFVMIAVAASLIRSHLLLRVNSRILSLSFLTFLSGYRRSGSTDRGDELGLGHRDSHFRAGAPRTRNSSSFETADTHSSSTHDGVDLVLVCSSWTGPQRQGLL
jgi:hypothetical protein